MKKVNQLLDSYSQGWSSVEIPCLILTRQPWDPFSVPPKKNQIQAEVIVKLNAFVIN